LAGNYIYSVFVDSKQRVWIGNSEKGLSVFDSSRFRNYGRQNGFADVKIRAIAEDNDGKIYLGTDGQGVYTYDGSVFSALQGMNGKFIRAIQKDKDGNMWFATAGKGIYKLYLGEKKPLKNFYFNDGRMTCLHEDKLGRMWYGSESNGIGYISGDEVQKAAIGLKQGLPSNVIRCLTEDESGHLWVGTGGSGIASVDLYHGDFVLHKIDHTNGLTSSNVYLLIADKKDNLFVGSETGLDYLILDKSRKLLQAKHYSKGEGFTGIETCQNASCQSGDGGIWFGTINGLFKYNPKDLAKNQSPPLLRISNVRLFNESLSKTKYKNYIGDWQSVKYLELPYAENNLSFDFNGVNLSNPDAVRYSWQLENLEQKWSEPTTQNNINYSNLSPGNYTFLVKASNEDGVWTKEPVKLEFTITPPFWLRWWFLLGLSVFVVLGVFLLFRWRLRRVQIKSLEMQNKLKLEKEVVELEQKALRLQMNPHFIFNALNSIQSQIGNNNEQSARYYLAKFSRLMRQILDNSRNSLISLDEEVNTLENYLLIEKFCNGERFDYSITVSENLSGEDVKVPPMLLQPFIENAIKHGLKFNDQQRGKILVRFEEKNHLLECTVEDNGVGRKKAGELQQQSKEKYHQSTALIVTQERLQLLKKESDYSDLEIIDLCDANGVAKGTRVILRIPII
jgi:streptogramin lyase